MLGDGDGAHRGASGSPRAARVSSASRSSSARDERGTPVSPAPRVHLGVLGARSTPSCATRASRPSSSWSATARASAIARRTAWSFNRYLNVPGSVYPRLGWHTDGLRDLFYGRMPQEMLNIGLHLDRCTRDERRPAPHSRQPPPGLLVDVLPQAVLRLAPARSGRGLRRDRARRPDGARRPALASRRALDARSARPACAARCTCRT